MDEVNVPSEDELRASFDKGVFDAVQADAEAAADRDAKQIFSDAFAEMNFPVPVLADAAPTKGARNPIGGEARESTKSSDQADSRGGGNAGGKTPATFYEKATNTNEASERKALRSIHRSQTKKTESKAVETNAKKPGETSFTDSSPKEQNNEAEHLPIVPQAHGSETATRTPRRSQQADGDRLALSGLPPIETSPMSGGENSLEPTCEFPKPDGKEICGQPATQVVTISGFRWSYAAKACSKCADAIEKEARVNKGRDK